MQELLALTCKHKCRHVLGDHVWPWLRHAWAATCGDSLHEEPGSGGGGAEEEEEDLLTNVTKSTCSPRNCMQRAAGGNIFRLRIESYRSHEARAQARASGLSMSKARPKPSSGPGLGPG